MKKKEAKDIRKNILDNFHEQREYELTILISQLDYIYLPRDDKKLIEQAFKNDFIRDKNTAAIATSIRCLENNHFNYIFLNLERFVRQTLKELAATEVSLFCLLPTSDHTKTEFYELRYLYHLVYGKKSFRVLVKHLKTLEISKDKISYAIT